MGSPILTIQDLRTLSSREERLKEHFKISSICPIYPLAPDISDIEPFDEFEVLHLYMKHYYIGFGTNCSESADELSEYFSDNSFKPGSTESSKNSVACEERIRFPGRTFSGYQIDSKRKLCVSGLGVDNESSAKQDNVSTLVEIKEESAKTLNIDADEVLLPQVVSLADKLVVFGGRRNPRKPNQNLKVFRSGDYGNIFEEKSEVFGVYRSAICKISESSFLCFGGRRADGAFSNTMVEISVEESGTVAVSTRYIEFEEELPRLASATCSKFSNTEFEIIGGLLPNGKISDEILRIRIDGSKGERRALAAKLDIEICWFINFILGEITWRRKLDFGIYGHSIHFCETGNRMLIIGGISTLHEINDAGKRGTSCIQLRLIFFLVIEIDRESWKIMSIKEMSSKELLLVGNGARVTKESENQTEIEIIGGGAHCFAFGNHLNPLIATISF